MFKKILISLVKGIFDLIPIIPRIKENITDDKGFTIPGKYDCIRLLSSIITIMILILFFLGKLDFAQMEKLLKYFF
tara:strand:- start:332 stop:559 length:228 start_codon:yes stop_codon:yes gene_type:complete